MTQHTKQGREELPQVGGQGQRPRVPGFDRAGMAERSYQSPRSGVAGRSHLAPKARDSGPEESPHARGQGRWMGGATQGAVAARAPEGLEELFYIQARRGSNEEIPLIQGKEQRLCFAGAAVKRYPTPKVRETQVRW